MTDFLKGFLLYEMQLILPELELVGFDVEQSEPGTEVTLVWGEEGDGSSKPVVERHKQVHFRATVAPAPYAEVVRSSYRPH